MLAAVRPLLAASQAPTFERRVPDIAPEHRGDRFAVLRRPSVLDRRGAPRHGAADRTPVGCVDRFTATTHRPLGLTFALGVDGQWALMTGLTIAPYGVLLRALDPRDADLEAPARDVLAAWRRLGAGLGPQASPLWFSTACIGARAFVAALAAHAASSSSSSSSVSSVVLRPLDDRPGLRGRTFTGRLAALVDPAPDVLGIDLDAVDLALLGAHAESRKRHAAPAAHVAEITERTATPPELEELTELSASTAKRAKLGPGARGPSPGAAQDVSQTPGSPTAPAPRPPSKRRRARLAEHRR